MKVVFTKTLKLCRFLENKKLFIDLLQGGPQWPINCYYNKFKTHNIKRCKTKRAALFVLHILTLTIANYLNCILSF